MPLSILPLPDLATTEALAYKLAPLLRRGDMLALQGDLGAGKTAFARPLLRALGVTGEVPSPAYTLVQHYETAAFPVYHFDLYRLKDASELDELGWDDAMADGVMLVEWPEHAGNRLPDNRLTLRFALNGEAERQCALEGHGGWAEREQLERVGRAAEIAGFLAEAGWGIAATEPIEADFSSRRYERLHRADGQTSILMDADANQRTSQFVALAWLLRSLDFSAPEIFAARPLRSLALMEDLGDANIGHLLDEHVQAAPFYLRAAAVLARLHQNFAPAMAQHIDIPHFTGELFATRAEKFLDCYVPFELRREASEQERHSFRAAWLEALKPVKILPQTLMLRDFMPDNAMDLAKRDGWRALGLLDFQDAGIGPIAYDLASFCEVVRRDGGDKFLIPSINHYYERAHPACSLKALQNGCRILSAQRHTRILGILADPAQKNRERKLAFLPRTRAYLAQLLQDEALRPVQAWMKEAGLLS
jgi:tRNA threonylcarbamoyl adenosine modification protein YjeE